MKFRRKRLQFCNICQADSVVVKIYRRKSDGKRMRFEYCIRMFCGYRRDLPLPERYQRYAKKPGII